MKKITAYFADWHLTKSSAAILALVNPLKGLICFDLKNFNETFITHKESVPSEGQLLFFQVLPEIKFLRNNASRITWVPMLDDTPGNNDPFWMSFPKEIRVVSYSSIIHQRAKKFGIKSLYVKFFLNPNDFQQANWSDGLNIYYWNRRNLFSQKFIINFIKKSNAKKFYYRSDLDPVIKDVKPFTLPEKIGRTLVKSLGWSQSREEYLSTIKDVNVFIAPRECEGIGITFLEFMAKGCAVFAYHNPTMSEYINDSHNGYLFSKSSDLFHHKLCSYVQGKLSALAYKFTGNTNNLGNQVLHFQNWRRIDFSGLERIGMQSRFDHENGYHHWKRNLSQLAEFISG
ncbi:glycosyltransferase [Oscillatoria laete-virens NRMC-F 0139]|nr:glycosyltransferase [Oscillatoria laete-virens]MDL5055474.1 glycosyltransferase [Oscillatoria laete-virens NRMC-F 0139]